MAFIVQLFPLPQEEELATTQFPSAQLIVASCTTKQ